jgi:hypothetical protein
MPAVEFVVRGHDGNAVSGLEFRIDGAISPFDGTALRLDLGEHTFEFRSPGHVPVVKKLLLHENAAVREDVLLAKAAPSPSVEPTPRASAPVPNAGLTIAGAPQQTLALIAGGSGVMLLGVGGLSALLANSNYNAAVAHCDAPDQGGQRHCSPDGIYDYGTARALAAVSTATVTVGTLLVVGGLVLFVTAPRTHQVSIAVGPENVRLQGRW